MKCDNCETQAAYCVNDPGTNAVYYCSSCLPNWQHERALAGHFPLPTVVKAKASSKTTVSVEETETSVSDEDK